MKILFLFITLIAALLSLLFIHVWLGVQGFGPVRVCETRVTRLYIDHSNKQSHYMVGTTHGVFEVDNLIIAWQWNADELYAKMREGECYRLKIKGNRVVNFLFQEYPYIINVEPVASASANHPQPEAGHE